MKTKTKITEEELNELIAHVSEFEFEYFTFMGFIKMKMVKKDGKYYRYNSRLNSNFADSFGETNKEITEKGWNRFMNKLFSMCRIMNYENKYMSDVLDIGSWNMTVKFDNRKTKTSTGYDGCVRNWNTLINVLSEQYHEFYDIISVEND